uniref:Uncharacterized protein n=1 Tax=Lotharella globosa TaxID=91324 RepID=A0A7S3Y893_9EUKA
MASASSEMKAKEDKQAKKKKLSTLEMLARAYERVPEHERDKNHPTSVCLHLLQNSPAKLRDVIPITMRACRECGLPPGIKFPPGKSLMKAYYEVDRELNGTPANELDAEAKKAAYQTWMEMSQTLDKTLKLLFDKAKDHLGS